MRAPGRRSFWLWYGAVLASLLGGIQTARATREAEPEEAEPSPPQAVVLALPPKLDRGPDAREGAGESQIYTWDRCQGMPPRYADTCFAALARQRAERDPEGGLEACAAIGEAELRFECMADVAEGYSLVDVQHSLGLCETIPRKKWRDQCVFGISTAWALRDPGFALATCEHSGQWRAFCRHDVNGERATVDPAGAAAYCDGLDARRDTCWHGIGKYIGRVEVARAIEVCQGAPPKAGYRGECVHGAGWAAAETQGEGALAWCEPLTGTDKDACILGVAYHTKRFDPPRAAELCKLAADAGERRLCLDFVGRTGVKAPSF